MDANDILKNLKELPFLKGISDKVLESIAQGAAVRIRPPRAGIYYQGDSADHVFFLLDGTLKIGNVSPDGREVIHRVVRSSEMFGEEAVLIEGDREMYAIPLKLPAKFLSIRKADFQAAIAADAKLAQRFIEFLGQRVKIAETEMEKYVLENSYNRIVDFILQLSAKYGKKSSKGIKANHLLTHQDIAGITGASRQFVTSVFNGLRSKGLIDFSRTSITVLDHEGLLNER